MDAAGLNSVLTILQIAIIILGGFYFLWKIESKLQILTVSYNTVTSRLDKVDIKLDGLTAIAIQLAKQEERMNAQDNRVQELSNRIEVVKFVQSDNVKRAAAKK